MAPVVPLVENVWISNVYTRGHEAVTVMLFNRRIIQLHIQMQLYICFREMLYSYLFEKFHAYLNHVVNDWTSLYLSFLSVHTCKMLYAETITLKIRGKKKYNGINSRHKKHAILKTNQPYTMGKHEAIFSTGIVNTTIEINIDPLGSGGWGVGGSDTVLYVTA